MIANVKIILLIGLLFSFSISANAQNESEEIKLPSERYALLFQIGENFNLSSFDGSVISFKYHFENSNALRIGVSISGSSYDEEYSTDSQVFEDNATFLRDNFYGRVNIEYLIYNELFKDITFLYGCGPFLAYFNNYTLEENEDQSNYSTEETEWNYGLDVKAGFEWFVSTNFSFIAEYSLTFANSINELKVDGTYDISSTRTRDRFEVQGQGVKIGLTVYL